MAKKFLFDSIDVPAPCPKKWDEMIGDDKTRLCQSCDKQIYNVSAMTRGAARRLLFESKERVCIRLEKDADGKVRTLKKQFHKITRQAPIAAGVISASLAFSALTYAQGEAVIGTTSATVSAKRQDKKTSQISFTIYDPRGEIVPNESVKLTNQKTKEEFTVSTNQQGGAQFGAIPHGIYDIDVSGGGFNNYHEILRIKEAVEPNIKITLMVGYAVGVFVVDWSEIPLFRAIAQKDNEVVKQQINSGFDVNTKDEHGETALHVAVQHGNLEMIRFLLEKGAKVNIKDAEKRTPLLMIHDSLGDDDGASLKEIVRLLVSRGADINVRNEDNETFLMSAAEDDNVEGVKFLLELGANPNLKDGDGETAMQKTDSDEIKRLLKQYGARE